MPGFRGRNIVLAVIAAFTGSFAFRLSVPVVAYYSRFVLEVSATAIGALMAVYFIGRAPMAALAGHLYSGKRSILASTLCFVVVAAITPLYAFSKSLVGILAIRVLQGALLGYAWTIVQIVVGASTPLNVRATVYAIYFVAGSTAFPAANAVYTLLASQPPLVPLLVSSIFFIVSGLTVGFMGYVGVKGSRRVKGEDGLALLMIILLLFILVLRLGTAFTMSDIVYIYLCEVYGLDRGGAVLLLALASAIGIAVSIPLNVIADRVSERLAVLTIGLLASIGLILFSTNNVIFSSLGLALLLMGARSVTPLSRRIALTYASSEGVGYVGAVGNVGVLLSSLTVGIAYDMLEVKGLNVTSLFNPIIMLTAPLTILALALTAILTFKLKHGQS